MRKNADSLYDLALRFYEKGKRAIVPLFGYSGLQLTGATIKQNQFNHLVQFRSLSRLYDRFRPDAMFFSWTYRWKPALWGCQFVFL